MVEIRGPTTSAIDTGNGARHLTSCARILDMDLRGDGPPIVGALVDKPVNVPSAI